MFPAVAAIFATPQATVVTGDDHIGVGRIYPEVVKIAMAATGNHAEAFPAVDRQQQDKIGLERFVLVFGIDDEISEVKRAPDHVVAGVKARPGGTTIVRAIQRAVL